MRTILKPAALAAVLSLLAAALPAVAGSGDVVSIALRDFNRNGKIDRAIVRISNPSRATWSVKDGSGFSMTYAGAPLRISDVFVASAASDPALIEVVLDEGDAATPATTSADGFELVYRRIGTNGASAAGTELSAIAAGDTGAGDTELDEAAPLLVSSSPAAGDAEVRRRDDLRLVFSEPVSLSSLVPSSSNNPGGWTFSSAEIGRAHV